MVGSWSKMRLWVWFDGDMKNAEHYMIFFSWNIPNSIWYTQFIVIFIFSVKTCPKLPVPYYGMATCKNSDLNLFFDYTTRNQTFMQFYNDDEARVTELMPIDTDCKFKCGPGYYMIGSAIRNCLPLSKWDGLQTTCKRKIHLFPFYLIQNFFHRLFLFFIFLFNMFSFFSIFSFFVLFFPQNGFPQKSCALVYQL